MKLKKNIIEHNLNTKDTILTIDDDDYTEYTLIFPNTGGTSNFYYAQNDN